MSKLMVISDTHLGVKRQTGTTLESQTALHRSTMSQFKALLNEAESLEADLLINGDLFDSYEVSKACEFEVFTSLFTWCNANPKQSLILSAGNHDLSRDSSKKSSFENLCDYLTAVMKNVVVVKGAAQGINHQSAKTTEFVVPHMPNQELFDAELESILSYQEANQSVKVVFVHANYDNFFAREADHSLNVSAEMARRFEESGITLVFGHEHKKRQIGNVHIVGNQIVTSIADCLGDDFKQYVVWEGKDIEYIEFSKVSEIYEEVDWRSEVLPNKPFIRVSGTAEYQEAAEVTSKLVNWRKDSNALVITNAVKVGQMEVTIEGTEESIKESFAIESWVLEQMPEELKGRFKELVDG